MTHVLNINWLAAVVPLSGVQRMKAKRCTDKRTGYILWDFSTFVDWDYRWVLANNQYARNCSLLGGNVCPKLCKQLISLTIVNELYWQNCQMISVVIYINICCYFCCIGTLNIHWSCQDKRLTFWLYKEYFCLFLVWFMNNQNKHLSSIKCE